MRFLLPDPFQHVAPSCLLLWFSNVSLRCGCRKSFRTIPLEQLLLTPARQWAWKEGLEVFVGYLSLAHIYSLSFSVVLHASSSWFAPVGLLHHWNAMWLHQRGKGTSNEREEGERNWILYSDPSGTAVICAHNPSSDSWQTAPSIQLSSFFWYLHPLPALPGLESPMTTRLCPAATSPGSCIILYAIWYLAFTSITTLLNCP